MFRRKTIGYSGFNDYSSMKKWFYVVLVFVVIAIIWVAYFVFRGYAGSGDISINGQILYKDKPLSAVSISVGISSVVTDEDGNYIIPNLEFGRNKIKITKEGYYDKEKTVFLWKKNQALAKISLDRDEGFSAYFSGVVVDGFDKKPIKGAIVSLGQSNVTSDERGEFVFSDMPKGNLALSISAIGYTDLTQEANLGAENNNGKEFVLTPYGKVTFTSDRSGKKDVYSINYDGTNLRDLTANIDGDSWGGKYSPDGMRLVFFSNIGEALDRWGQKIPALYVLNKNSNKPVKISRDLVIEGDFEISGDSQRVVFVGRDGITSKSAVYIAGLGNTEWIQLTDEDTAPSNVDISNDGNWVVYGHADKEGRREVKMINVSTRDTKYVFTNSDTESFMSYSPDGKSLIYTKEGMDFMTRLFVFDIASEKETSIYKTSSNLRNIVWSADSKKILFTSTRDDRTYVFSLDIDGKNELKLTEQSGQYDHLVWPVKQNILAFSIYKADGYVLAVMDISQRKIVEIEKIGDDTLSWDRQGFDTVSGQGL